MGRSASSSELRDSAEAWGDPAALRARLAVEGYVFIRQLLDPTVVGEIGQSALRFLQHAGWTENRPDPVSAPPVTPIRAVRMRDAFGDAGYRRILADPGFNKLAFSGPLPDLMGQLLGPSGFCYPLKLPRIVYPASMVPRQPGNVIHKDYRAVQDMFTAWVPLVDVPASLGGLAVQPGSQRTSRVRYRPLDHLERGWATTDYEPGDVLVFHCLTTHAALPNREHRLRVSAEYRWQLADQPVPQRVALGPFGQEIGSRMFSRTNWWRSVVKGLTLFDDGGEGARPRLPAPPSRFVSFSN
ncbi:MAG: phytanoyl-CoA dioxygenase family protein [Acidimicrobiales bacterium]